MRARRFTTWLVLGIAVTLAYVVRRSRRAAWRHAAPPAQEAAPPAGAPAAEPEVSAVPADLDLDRVASAIDEVGGMHVEELGDAAESAAIYGDRRAARGSGELYDLHLPPAADREVADDDQAQGEGQNWLERLETSTAELGPEPERELDIIDDSDPHPGHHKTDTDDTPVADRGSAGPRGL